MEIKIQSSEEWKGIITIHLTNGHKITFETSKLEDYVTANELNLVIESCGNGLTCNPNCVEYTTESIIPVDQFIDDNWTALVEKYYKQVILKS